MPIAPVPEILRTPPRAYRMLQITLDMLFGRISEIIEVESTFSIELKPSFMQLKKISELSETLKFFNIKLFRKMHLSGKHILIIKLPSDINFIFDSKFADNFLKRFQFHLALNEQTTKKQMEKHSENLMEIEKFMNALLIDEAKVSIYRNHYTHYVEILFLFGHDEKVQKSLCISLGLHDITYHRGVDQHYNFPYIAIQDIHPNSFNALKETYQMYRQPPPILMSMVNNSSNLKLIQPLQKKPSTPVMK